MALPDASAAEELQKCNTCCALFSGGNLGVVNIMGLWQSQHSQLNREFTMSFKKATVVALLAASMSSAPVMAQTAASASSPATASARAGATTESSSELRGGFLIPLIAIVAVILGIVAAVGGGDDGPTSP
ncbi:MAG: hypothetical protein AB7O91_10495 [Sphingomonas sp.]